MDVSFVYIAKSSSDMAAVPSLRSYLRFWTLVAGNFASHLLKATLIFIYLFIYLFFKFIFNDTRFYNTEQYNTLQYITYDTVYLH